jgi:hypothetical protein
MKKKEVARELKNHLPFAENVMFSCGDLPLPGEHHAADPAGRRGQTAEGTRRAWTTPHTGQRGASFFFWRGKRFPLIDHKVTILRHSLGYPRWIVP